MALPEAQSPLWADGALLQEEPAGRHRRGERQVCHAVPAFDIY